MAAPAYPGVHRIPKADFAALASGYGDPTTVARLKNSRLSKHLLLIRALLDAAPPSSAGGLRAGLALLTDVQRVRPEVVSGTLVHPHVGAWAAYCLRVMRGTDIGYVPLETDLGHLAAAAAAAAIEAQVDFEVNVPAREGLANLPAFGSAVVHPGLRAVHVVGVGGEVVVDGRQLPGDLSEEDSGWLPLRRLHAVVDDCSIAVTLDDLEPFRNCHRLAVADRLVAADITHWQRCLDAAWALLVRHHRNYADAIAAGLTTLVPLAAERAAHGVNATSMDAFGAILASPPADGQALAVALVHEFQHAKLGALLDLLPLHDDSTEARYYAPWRDDPRPLGGLLHGAYAFLGVADFWRVQRIASGGRSEFAQFEFVRWWERVRRVLDVIVESGRLTPEGIDFVGGMRATLERWPGGSVPTEMRALAQDAADDHSIGWRIRNLRPDREYVRQLVKAWQAGDLPPIDSRPPVEVRPSSSRALVRSVRLDLIRLRLSQPDRFAQLTSGPTALLDAIPDATRGDVAYLRGHYAAAITDYRALIAAEPHERAHWAGLALALHRLGPSPAATALLAQPEIVFAVYRQLAACDLAPHPDVLADWLAGICAGLPAADAR
jgi:HEXXH motif-containing protein